MDELHKKALEVARRILESPDDDENVALARMLLEAQAKLPTPLPSKPEPRELTAKSA